MAQGSRDASQSQSVDAKLQLVEAMRGDGETGYCVIDWQSAGTLICTR